MKKYTQKTNAELRENPVMIFNRVADADYIFRKYCLQHGLGGEERSTTSYLIGLEPSSKAQVASERTDQTDHRTH